MGQQMLSARQNPFIPPYQTFLFSKANVMLGAVWLYHVVNQNY